MMEESAMGDFANRLKQEFEEQASNASDSDECQDWFVNDTRNDERPPSPVPNGGDSQQIVKKGETTVAATASTRPVRSASSPASPTTQSAPSDAKASTAEEQDEYDRATGQMAFLHHSPPTFAILVMELVTGVEVPRYGSKFFRFYIPQVHDSQTDFCLFTRKRLNKHKFRFSLDDSSMTTWTDPCYGGKILMTPTADIKRFKLLAAKPAGRVQFDIKQEARKQELVVRLNSQATRFNFFRARAASVDSSDVYRSNIQKFINPMADVRCSKTNYTLFKIEKEGEAGMQKYVISYMRPFSLFVRYERALANMKPGPFETVVDVS